MENEISRAPWTKSQVTNLNRWQTCGFVHPFTCGNCRDNHPVPEPTLEHANAEGPPEVFPEYELRATSEGWVCDTCDYTQDWAWKIMTTFTAAAAKRGNPFGGPKG